MAVTVYIVKAFSILEFGLFFNRTDAETYIRLKKSEDCLEDYSIEEVTDSQIIKLPYGDPLDGPPYLFLE